MDSGAVIAAAAGIIGGLLTWHQARAANRRADFVTITERLDRELKNERTQRRLLTGYVLELWRWADRVGPDTPAGPPPPPPRELDLAQWRS
ncbi:hypothetical protein G3I51_23790 [Streptomyces sp. SID9944]|nr:hypothetical protein [Streptomyces sp. SID9944]